MTLRLDLSEGVEAHSHRRDAESRRENQSNRNSCREAPFDVHNCCVWMPTAYLAA